MADEVFILADSSKFEKTCFYNMGHISEIDGIVSETELPQTIVDMLKNSGR